MSIEALLRFTLQYEMPNGFLAIPIRWREDEIYTLFIRQHEVEIIEQWGNGKPSPYARRTRHFNLNTLYWVRYRLTPDPFMPSHPRIAVYIWKDGKEEPKSTRFPYLSRKKHI